MGKRMNIVYVNYDEAQRLIPVFKYYAEEGPWKEVRSDASQILRELEDVRNVDYRLSGKQIFLSEEQHEFFNDVRAEFS